jgi:hypothetical protein
MRLHILAWICASRPQVFEIILISILVEQEKEMVELKREIEGV